MLTINDDHMRLLADDPVMLGRLLVRLALDVSFDDLLRTVIKPREGWTTCPAGTGAIARHRDKPMQGYMQEGGDVVLTTVQMGAYIGFHAEGAGWAIKADDPEEDWSRTWHRAADTTIPSIGAGHADIHVGEPWHFQDHAPTEPYIEDVPALDESADDMRPHQLDLPAWLKPGYDWDRAISENPTNSLSRIAVLANGVGVEWDAVVDEDRPTHAMMNLIETELGIETTIPHVDVHRLTLGKRIDAAEAAMATQEEIAA